ncbi:fluoride efflux transporter CrcB [Lewinella sp. 4G2]|uniref:fluoride efflux transporter CrcB n=1 Tax=Lewinella sp. 4G2 TaxID=1803372 RepID=UPI0007B47EE4|nr:fluoride efflux transporter CrcB [Lewinella sp. 4G2]OAV43024.1 hypothetical protein A3850_000245 [Lewinella sp. 4G2]
MPWLLVFLGGGLGSLCRYAISRLLPLAELAEGDIPWATLLANALACLLLGVLLALLAKEQLPKELSFLLVTGFCGGFSTFSTFSAELLSLLEAGHYGAALTYAAISLFTGLVAIWVTLLWLR